MHAVPTSRPRDVLQGVCGDDDDCGSCTYSIVNGVWTRVGTGNCNDGCGCAQTKTDAQVFWLLLLCSPTVDPLAGTLILGCTPPDSSVHKDTDFVKLTEDLADKLPIRERQTLIYVRHLIKQREFWRWVAIPLGVLTVLLGAGLAYMIFGR